MGLHFLLPFGWFDFLFGKLDLRCLLD